MKVTWAYRGMRKNEDDFSQKLAMDPGERRESLNLIQKFDYENFSSGDPHIGKIAQFCQKC